MQTKKQKYSPFFKKIAIAISLVFVGMFISTLITSATSPTNVFTISSGIYPLATWTIWKEGNTNFAKNINGSYPESNTNLTALIHYCQNNMNSGGIIHLISGRYNVNSTILLKQCIIIEGEGMGRELTNQGTILYNTGNFPTIQFLQYGSLAGKSHEVKNMLLVGANSTIKRLNQGIYIPNATDFEITYVFFYRFWKGVNITKANIGLFDNCYFWEILDCGVIGLGQKYWDINELAFRNCHLEWCYGRGIYLEKAMGIKMTDCGFIAEGKEILYIQNGWDITYVNNDFDFSGLNTTTYYDGIVFHNVSWGRISNSWIGANRGRGLLVYNSKGISVIGCTIHTNGLHGVGLDNAFNCTFSNSIFYGNSVETYNAYSDIYINNSNNNTIIGNVFMGTLSKYAIQEVNTSNWNIVIGNICKGVTGAKLIIGSKTINQHNLPS